jgi:TRAP transporter 4TM/12TM fusion protein
VAATVESLPARLVRLAVAGLAVAMSLWHVWIIVVGPPEAVIFRATHLAFALGLVFLTVGGWPLRRSDGLPSWSDWAFAVLAVLPIGYLFWNYDYLVNRMVYVDDPTFWDQVMAVVMVLAVLEGTRRAIGWALPLTALVFLGYTFLFTHVTWLQVVDQTFLTTEGIFGSTLAVSASFVVVFVLFGAFMERSGTGRLFMDFAMALTGRSAGGPGKVAVVSSSLFGTVSGSAVANVMVTGQVTIPLMKRAGFRPPFAAGVEATASTGGQIMPPIMGAAAFVMAEFMGVPYLTVVTWALIPAVLFYAATFMAVHFEAKRSGLTGLPPEEVPRLGRVLAESGHLFVPVAAILLVLLLGYSAPYAAFVGTLLCFPVALLRASTRGSVTLANLVDALIEGAKGAIGVAMACACAGIVIGIIALTGVGIVFTQVVVNVSGSSLFLALLLTMAAGIVLGMGMPTTPAYIVMVSLLVPAIIRLGVEPAAAHMFAFYFAILSAITPPVALAVFAAAGLAKSDLWPSGWAAVKIGAAGFIVPFMFVYEPALLFIGPLGQSLHAAVSACIGATLLAASLHGWLFGPASAWQRVVLFAAALALIQPGGLTDLIGLALAGVVIAAQVLARRRGAAATRRVE